MITSAAAFRTYGPGGAFVNLTDAQIEWALQGAEDLAASYLSGRGYGELTAAGNDYQAAVFKIAAWDLVVLTRGVNPADPAHAALKMQRDEAVGWLRDVAEGVANLGGATVAPTRVAAGLAAVFLEDTTTSGHTTEGW